MPGGSTKTKTIDPYAGTGIRELYNKLTNFISPQIGQGVTPYSGQIVPDISSLQQTGFDLAGGLTPLIEGGQNYFTDVLGMISPESIGGYQQMAETGLGQLMQPFDISAAMASMDPARKYAQEFFMQDIAPSIVEKYGPAAGAKNAGAIWDIMGKQAGQMGTALGANLGQYIYQGSQAQANRQQQGVNQLMNMMLMPGNVVSQAGQIGGMGSDILSQLMNIGGIQRGISGEMLQEPYQKWSYSQPYNNPYLNLFGMAASQPPMTVVDYGGGAGASSLLGPLGSFLGTEGGSELFGNVLSGAGGLLSGLGGGLLEGLGGVASGILGLFSDMRLKENIRPIEDALDKLETITGYTYNLKHEPYRKKTGLVAQEIETVTDMKCPEHHGFKQIDLETAFAVIAILVNAVKELKAKLN